MTFARDVRTVVWKEVREFICGLSSRTSKLGILMTLGVFGIFVPIQMGSAIVAAPALGLVWAWMPIMILGQLVIDSLAGERERHTLESLLATRLPDSAILVGKLVASVGYAMVYAAILVALAVVTINLTVPRGIDYVLARGTPGVYIAPGQIVLVDPAALVALVIGFALFGFLVACIAALVSMRSTLRQAGQLFGVGLALIVIVPFGIAQVLPDVVRPIVDAAAGADLLSSAAILYAVLIAADAALLAVCVARFRRTELPLF